MVKFVSHPHCQQLLVSLWYDGISGYRRRNIAVKTLIICLIALLFPFFSLIYLIMPHSRIGKILRQPFIKFICHSASYVLFLCTYFRFSLSQTFFLKKYCATLLSGLLILASLRIKSIITGLDEDDHKEKRGPPPTSIEWMIFCYVASITLEAL